jgi:hypothetical protein
MPHRVPPRPPRAGPVMPSGDRSPRSLSIGPVDGAPVVFHPIDRGTPSGRPLVYAETVLLVVGMLAGLMRGRGLRGSVRDTLVGYGIASYLAQWASELEWRQ